MEAIAETRDWTIEDAKAAGVIPRVRALPSFVDLRERWWKVQHQKQSSACSGYALAYGLLWWHFIKAGIIARAWKSYRPSARFIWMAGKELDPNNYRPTTFLDTAGTDAKTILDVARKYGCVLERDLPMDGDLSQLSVSQFYAKASKLKIKAYYNLGKDQQAWKAWLAHQGPILVRLHPDEQFFRASRGTLLSNYAFRGLRDAHFACLVGYNGDRFLLRNSWGSRWADRGHVWMDSVYAHEAITEGFGVGV